MTTKKISVTVEDMETGDLHSHLFQFENRDQSGRCRAQIGAWLTDIIHLVDPSRPPRWEHLLKPQDVQDS